MEKALERWGPGHQSRQTAFKSDGAWIFEALVLMPHKSQANANLQMIVVGMEPLHILGETLRLSCIDSNMAS